MHCIGNNLEVKSWKSEPDFDVDIELNTSEATSNSRPRTDSEHGNVVYQVCQL